jgi:predicted nucleotidyltransferase
MAAASACTRELSAGALRIAAQRTVPGSRAGTRGTKRCRATSSSASLLAWLQTDHDAGRWRCSVTPRAARAGMASSTGSAAPSTRARRRHEPARPLRRPGGILRLPMTRTDPDLERRIAACLAARKDVVLGYLFGSHAEGRAHRDSDVDVAVLVDRAQRPTERDRFDLRVELTSELIAALHCNDVDLVVLDDAPPLFARRVALEGRLVHCQDPGAEHAFRRDVQLRAADVAPFLERARRRRLESL